MTNDDLRALVERRVAAFRDLVSHVAEDPEELQWAAESTLQEAPPTTFGEVEEPTDRRLRRARKILQDACRELRGYSSLLLIPGLTRRVRSSAERIRAQLNLAATSGIRGT